MPLCCVLSGGRRIEEHQKKKSAGLKKIEEEVRGWDDSCDPRTDRNIREYHILSIFTHSRPPSGAPATAPGTSPRLWRPDDARNVGVAHASYIERALVSLSGLQLVSGV